MAVFLSPVGGAGAQFFDNNGIPLTGGKLYTYAAGTTTPAVTYTSSAGSVAQSNPIILDAAGRVSGSSEIWLTDGTSYKFVLKDSSDVLIATWDNISGNGDPAFSYYAPDTNSLLAPGPLTVKSALDQITDADEGASKVGYLAPYTGTVYQSVKDKLKQTVSVKDFGAVGDGVTNDTVAIEAALAASARVYFPTGVYFIGGSTIEIPTNAFLYGDGESSVILADATTRTNPKTDNLFNVYNSHITIRDLKIDGDRPNAVQEISSIYVDQGASDCLIENVSFKDHGCGVWMVHCDRINVVDCKFEDGSHSKGHIVTEGSVPGSGLTNYATNVLVTGNYFGESTEEAIDINARTRGMIIDNNFFYKNYTSDPLPGENNEVIDIGSDSDCFDIIVSNNRCNGAGYPEAFVYIKQGSERVTIENNIVTNLNVVSTDPGASFAHIANSKHVNVIDNTINNACRLAIIHERSSTVKAEYVNIVGNSISGVVQEGIRLDNCTNSTTYVNVDGNSISSTSSTTYGIWGIECVDLNISNNIITGFGGRGIQLASGVDKFTVVGNQINGCSIGVYTQTGYGVISGNSVANSVAEGIVSVGVGNVISGNMVTGSGTDGIALNASDKNAVTGNVCTSNGNYGLRVVANSANVAVVGNMLSGNTVGSLGNAAGLTGASVNANNVV